MSITYINTSFNDSSGTSSLSISKPTNTQTGDVMFAIICNLSYAYPNSSPTGWTLLAQQQPSSYHQIYYKIATSSEPSSYSWGWQYSGKCGGIISTFRGSFNTSNLIHAYSANQYTTSNTTVRANSMNISKTGLPLIFFACGYENASIDYTKPSVPTSDWVENYDDGSPAGDYYFEVCSMTWNSSGSTGNIDAIRSVSTSSSKQAFAVALNLISGPANVKTINGLEIASVKTLNGLEMASVKTIGGLA